MDYFFANVMADGQEKDEVAIDAEEPGLVNWCQVCWGVKECCCGWCESGWDEVHTCAVQEF